ncbi:MAG: recombinase RecA [Oscillospiraceae bacterium]|nr:recombinase RecA [Oscillospiraceae bacterium]
MKALKAAMSDIEKQYGSGAVMFLSGDKAARMNIESSPTGSLTLDLALGVGGLPKGRIIEVFGAESGGKTTVALHAVAESQKRGGIAAFIDVEHALDPQYAKKLGCDVDNLLVSQPESGEQALEIMEKLARSGAVDVIVLDSVAAIVTVTEIEGNMGDSFMGVQARLMSQALRKLTSVISKTNTIAIFINQVRANISMYGPAETTPGGKALKFYSSVRIKVDKTSDQIKEGTEIIGVRTKVKIVKNKVAPPFRTAEFDMIFGKGISKTGEILDLAVNLGICRKSGAYFYYGEEKLGQGRENAKQFLIDTPEVSLEIENKIRAKSAELNFDDDDLKEEVLETARVGGGIETNSNLDAFDIDEL